MKKKIIIGAVLVVIILCIVAWFYGYYNHKSNDNLPVISSIVQMDEADVNELLVGYHKEQLIEVWGEPDNSSDNEYVWKTDDAILTVNTNNKEKIVVCSVSAGVGETVEFHGELFSIVELSEETLEWLEWYNSLTPEEQLAISYVPNELYSYDGSGVTETVADEMCEELPDLNTPILKINDILYYDTNETGPMGVADAVEGYIQTSVKENEIPAENEESNFGCVGNAYTKDNGDGWIMVLMDDEEWHIFKRKETVGD